MGSGKGRAPVEGVGVICEVGDKGVAMNRGETGSAGFSSVASATGGGTGGGERDGERLRTPKREAVAVGGTSSCSSVVRA